MLIVLQEAIGDLQRHYGRWLAELGLDNPPIGQIITNLARRYSRWMSSHGSPSPLQLRW